MIKFLSKDIWTTIESLSKKSKKTKVAVAYLGTGVAERLFLKKGDSLIIAMDLKNVKAGQVDPFEIQKFFDRRVLIYNLSNLHSKIYLFDNSILIGSANASSNSATHLIESGILTDDLTTIKDADKFIKENSIEKVEQDYIELCKKHYNPPKNFGSKTKSNNTDIFKGKLSRLWVISTKLTYFSEEDNAIVEKDKNIFEEKISDRRTFVLTEIKYQSNTRFIKNVQEGDILIEISKNKSSIQISQPKRALGISYNYNNRNSYLRVEERKKPVMKPWSKFENYLQQNAINSITVNSTKEIKNEEIKKVLLNFFNEENN